MAAFDLVTLSAVQAWGGTLTNGATNIPALITQVSRQILSGISRPSILPTTYSEIIDGGGQSRVTLRNWPVTAIQSLVIDNVAIPAAPSPASVGITPSYPPYGYRLSPWDGFPPGLPQWLDISGYRACSRAQNIAVSYTAGYQVSAEAQSVPATSPYTVTAVQPYGAWASDAGVTYAVTGVALSKVSGSPAQGQYSTSSGVYTFSAADEGAAVLISYGYIPDDLANAAAQWVVELLAYQTRIGLRSKSLGGQETMSYIVGKIPPMVDEKLQPYRRVILC